MVPIGTVAQLKDNTIPYRVPRYNLFPAAEVQGVAAPAVATGTALHRMEELAHQVLPKGIAFEWTDLAYQQQQRGTPTLLAFLAWPPSLFSSFWSPSTRAGSCRWPSS